MIVFRGGTVVSGRGTERRDLFVENGRLAAPGDADEIVDVTGKYLFPGFIDAHTHLDMPVSGTVTADDFASGSEAALCGGTTAVIDFATQDRGHTLAEALEVWHGRADGRCACDYGFHMAVTDWNPRTRRELGDMAAAGVTSFKCYMAYDNLRLGDDEIRRLLAAAGELGCVVGCHCERGDMVSANVASLLAGGHTAPRYHPLSRPNEVEALAVERFLTLAEEARGLPWIVHLSTREGLFQLDRARRRGLKVVAETCPQYLTLTDERYELPGFEGAKYVCSPPLRKAEDSAALWEAAADGRIDLISTDHCSFRYADQKTLGREDFSRIPNGMPGLEHRPAILWSEGVSRGRLEAADMCRLLSEGPARVFGLWGRKGSLEEGFDADIVVWDPDYRGTLRAADAAGACDYSPWEGFSLTGRAAAVYLRGVRRAENGRVVRSGTGEYLARKNMHF